MDLFEHSHAERFDREQPLAARMRPRTLEEFVGQEHILAPGRLLWRAIKADQLSSLIFYGPPGTGKTTLAAVIANTTESCFENLNAVLAGVSDIRRVTEKASRRMNEDERRTILFVDEVHRWNRAQQDALLPWVENGSVILIGATTENPYFTVNRALVSRSRIFQLKPLNNENLRKIAETALTDRERGYGELNIQSDKEAIEHLVNIANGDARGVLNALELAVATTEPDSSGVVRITMEVAEESIQRRAVLYDKEGDYHFDTISAFIKSMRGSDPDAALYWLAKMVYAGEDPRFVLRRMLIFAAEDIGLADPRALTVAESAAAAFDRVGMPEGQYHLGMAVVYLATAPKSNSVLAYFDALSTVENEREPEVPNHLKDGSRDKHGFGHGQGYSYPHAYREHWVAQQYLPVELQGKLFYQPGSIGYEKEIRENVLRRRESQMAAALESEDFAPPPEILTRSPHDRKTEYWLSRTVANTAGNLADIRELIFSEADCRRHDRVLCLNDNTGLLTWEAIRQTPEGGVYTHITDTAGKSVLENHIAECPPLRKPVLYCCDLPELLRKLESEISFERIVGRSLLFKLADKVKPLREAGRLLAGEGRIILAEPISKHQPRLSSLIKFQDQELADTFRETEEEIYTAPDDPMVNWDEENAAAWFDEAGFEIIKIRVRELAGQRYFPRQMINKWFKAGEGHGQRPSLGDKLSKKITPENVDKTRKALETALGDKSVSWETRWLIAVATVK